MFKIHVPFELKCPKREKKNEVVLCDDGREKKKKSFIVTHAVVTALGSAHCNCLSLCRKGKQQQEQIHHRVKGKVQQW